MSDKNQFKFMTPRGVAVFPNIQKPSKKFNKYECKLILDPEDEAMQAIVEKAEALRDEHLEKVKAELEAKRQDALKKKKGAEAKKIEAKIEAIKVADILGEDYDDQGEPTGKVTLKATAGAEGKRKDGSTFKREIHVFDSRNKKLTKVPAIFGGSELKMAGVAFPYYNPSSDTVGVSFRLEAVQVLKLVSTGGSAERYGFGAEEDGYADEGSGDHSFGSDEEGGDNDEGSSDDDDF